MHRIQLVAVAALSVLFSSTPARAVSLAGSAQAIDEFTGSTSGYIPGSSGSEFDPPELFFQLDYAVYPTDAFADAFPASGFSPRPSDRYVYAYSFTDTDGFGFLPELRVRPVPIDVAGGISVFSVIDSASPASASFEGDAASFSLPGIGAVTEQVFVYSSPFAPRWAPLTEGDSSVGQYSGIVLPVPTLTPEPSSLGVAGLAVFMAGVVGNRRDDR